MIGMRLTPEIRQEVVLKMKMTLVCPLCDGEIPEADPEGKSFAERVVLFGVKEFSLCPKCGADTSSRNTQIRWRATVKHWLALPEDRRI